MCLDNEIERMHAIRLIRLINSVAPKQMPHSLVYSIIAIGNDGAGERDRFVRICLATLCEIGKCCAVVSHVSNLAVLCPLFFVSFCLCLCVCVCVCVCVRVNERVNVGACSFIVLSCISQMLGRQCCL